MAYKYQPIKDEIFASDGEGDEVEELEEGEAEGETILGSLEGANVEGVAELPPNAKVKQVIEQDGVLILETVEADPNDPDALPAGATLLADGAGGTIIADAEGGTIIDASGAAIIDTNGATIIDTDAIISNGNGHDSTLDTTNGDSSMDDSAILAELEEANLDVKPSPSKKNKDILDQGEKVQCQLCNQSFPAGNLRWHILKEHCHNKVCYIIFTFNFNLLFPFLGHRVFPVRAEICDKERVEESHQTGSSLRNLDMSHLSQRVQGSVSPRQVFPREDPKL